MGKGSSNKKKSQSSGSGGMDIRRFFGGGAGSSQTKTKAAATNKDAAATAAAKQKRQVAARDFFAAATASNSNDGNDNNNSNKKEEKRQSTPPPSAETARTAPPSMDDSVRSEDGAAAKDGGSSHATPATVAPAKGKEKEQSPTTRAKKQKKKKRILLDDDSDDGDDGDESYSDDVPQPDDDDEDYREDEPATAKPKKTGRSSSSSTLPRQKKPRTSPAAAAPSQEGGSANKRAPSPTIAVATANAKRQRSASKNRKKPTKQEARRALLVAADEIPEISDVASFDDVVACCAPQCLGNTAFCLTGVFADVLSRDAAAETIKILGGRVVTAVSGQTDYLICGDSGVLEDGRRLQEGKKYRTALELGRASITVVRGAAQFGGLLRLLSDRQAKKEEEETAEATTSRAVAATATAATAKAEPAAAATLKVSNPYAKKASATAVVSNNNPYGNNPYAKKSSTANNLVQMEGDDRKPAAVAAVPKQKIVADAATANQLWVDRYKPASSREILGNETAVRKLAAWLNSWERLFNHDSKLGRSYSNPNGPWKAALLSGPPGIGKTTTATLVAQEAGRDVLEFNASDVRSKKAMQEAFGDITGSYTLQFDTAPTATTGSGSGSNGKKKKAPRTKRCIIMDEVDGMGAGDRSGMAELIQLIKKSRVPIVCICNDRQAQKIKSLLPYCLDLRYKRPTKSVIARRAVEVARREGLAVEPNAAEAVVESCGNDVRQVLNCLQMWASRCPSSDGAKANGAMTYKSLKEREHSINKDEILRVSLFDAARTILEGRRGLSDGAANPSAERSSLFKRMDAYFVDYNFVGLIVQQNYLKVVQGQYAEAKRRGGTLPDGTDATQDVLERMERAAHAMSDFAVAEGALRGGMNWSLLPATAALAVQTGYHAGGERGGFLPGYPEFTTYLGRNSTRGKKQRLLGELGHHMNFHVSGGPSEIRLSYLPALRDRFLTLLTQDEPNGGSVPEAIALMDEYGLNRDDVLEKLDEFKMDAAAAKSKSALSFQKMDSQTKSAFTRTYNAGAHRSQALVAEQGAPKKAKRGAGGSSEAALKDPDAIDDDEPEKLEDDDDEEEEEEELSADKVSAMFGKKRGRKGGGAKGKAKAAAKPRAKKAAPKKRK